MLLVTYVYIYINIVEIKSMLSVVTVSNQKVFYIHKKYTERIEKIL